MPTHSSDRWSPSERAVFRKMLQAVDRALPPSKRRTATRRVADTIPPVDPTRAPNGAYYQPPQGTAWSDGKNAAYEQSLRDAGEKMRARHAR